MQPLPTDWPIDPTVTDGVELADILNRFAGAVASNNSGAAPPANTQPGMFWNDTSTTPPTLRMRNSDNTGWITVSTSGAPNLLPDGSVAVPALAFASEPGLGLYRKGSAHLGWAALGAWTAGLDASAAGTTNFYIAPRTANGYAQAIFQNQPFGAVNFNQLVLGVGADGSGFVNAVATGTAAARTLNFSAPAGAVFSSSVRGTGFMLGTDTYFSQDGANVYLAFAANWYLAYEKASGALRYNMGATGRQFGLDPAGAGAMYSGGNLMLCGTYGDVNFGMARTSTERYIRWSNDEWRLRWVTANGSLEYVSSGGVVLFGINATGSGSFSGGTVALGTQGSAINPQTHVIRQYSVNGNVTYANVIDAAPQGMQEILSFQHAPGQYAQISMQVGPATFNFKNDNDAFKGGGANTWSVPSDRRLKQGIVDWHGGLTEILSLRVREFAYKAEPDVSYIGVVADEAERGFRAIIKRGCGRIDDEDVDDMATLYADPVQWALVNAVKTLHERLQALETA